MIPRYAILSHTWGADTEEVSFKDMMDGTGTSKPGYDKIRFCGEQAGHDDLQYFWIDTCCIDKSNSTELQEAINSMFHWYRNAAKCFVYLADVSRPALGADGKPSQLPWESSFRKSRWFTHICEETQGQLLGCILVEHQGRRFSKAELCQGSEANNTGPPLGEGVKQCGYQREHRRGD